jgi:hypothetical protein
MTLHATIINRNFSTRPIHPVQFRTDKLTWSIYGGPDEAFLSAGTPVERLFEFTGLLRCPITIADEFSIPAWWGYVNKIFISFEKSNFTISLEDLYNRVKVMYSFISPDGKLAEHQETSFAENAFSRTEFGTREIVLKQNNIDDDYALNLRDNFLALSAYPRSVLAPSSDLGDPIIKLHCKGWFHTLDWVSYQDLDGLYANHGPGPGASYLGNGTISLVAQSFTPAKSVKVKYAYVMLRKIGNPTSNITASIYSTSGDAPSTQLALSGTFAGSTLGDTDFTWVKFTFATPYTLTAATKYWLVITPNTSSSSNCYSIRIDENASYIQPKHYAKRFTSSWGYLPSVTHPGTPDLMFRVVCEQDTGQQLFDIATAGNQFFTYVGTIVSGFNTSPYRNNGYSALREVVDLMNLGTYNQRLITASVSVNRRLYWYEQPHPSQPTVFLDRFGRFFTKDQKFLQPYFPPIGQFAVFSGIDRVVMPFDRHRIPSYFVDKATYTP